MPQAVSVGHQVVGSTLQLSPQAKIRQRLPSAMTNRIDTCPCSICRRRRPSLTDFRLRPQLQRRPDDHEPRSQGQGQIKSSCRGRQRGAGTTELRARLVPSGQGRDDLGPSAAVPQFMSRVREPGWQDAQQMSPLPSPLLLPTQTLPEGQHSSLQ